MLGILRKEMIGQIWNTPGMSSLDQGQRLTGGQVGANAGW